MALPVGEGAETRLGSDRQRTTQGGPGIAHGGIVAAALDEACGLLATWHRFPTVTARFSVRYRRPAAINRPLGISARVVAERGRRIAIAAEPRDGDDLANGVERSSTSARALPPDARGPVPRGGWRRRLADPSNG